MFGKSAGSSSGGGAASVAPAPDPSPDPPSFLLNPFKLGVKTDNRVLVPGAGATWDDDRVAMPCTIVSGATVYKFFHGSDGATIRIGVATAPVSGFTGAGFTQSGSVLIDVGAAAQWDEDFVGTPFVFLDDLDDKWIMFYVGGSGLTYAYGYASAPNGSDLSNPANWTKYASNPVMTYSGVDWKTGLLFGAFAVAKFGASDYAMLFACGDPTQEAKIGLATASSRDGPWTESASNPIISPIGSGVTWCAFSVSSPRTFKKNADGTYSCYFQGKQSTGGPSFIGRATALADRVTWTKDATALITGGNRAWEQSDAVHPSPFETESPNLYHVGTNSYIDYDAWGASSVGTIVIPDGTLGTSTLLTPDSWYWACEDKFTNRSCVDAGDISSAGWSETGSPTYTAGKIGNALTLDGTQCVALTTAGAGELIGQRGASHFAISCWFKPTTFAAATTYCIASKWLSVNAAEWLFEVYESAGLYQVYIGFYTAGAGSSQIGYAIATFPSNPVNAWQHVMVYYNNTTNTAFISVNGGAFTSNPAFTGTPSTGNLTSVMTLGQRGNATTRFIGQIDEVWIRRGIIPTDAQAAWEYNSGAGRTPNELGSAP